MTLELNKDIIESFMEHKKIEGAIQERLNDILKKISIEINEIFQSCKGNILVTMNSETKVIIKIALNKDTIVHSCDFDILYSEASLLIELGNIKDLLYDIRRKINKNPPKPFWKKILGL